MTNQTIRLPIHNDEWIDTAAKLLAELVRQGVTFEARGDTSARNGELLLVEFSGGF